MDQRFLEDFLRDQVGYQDHQRVIPIAFDVDVKIPITHIPETFEGHNRIIDGIALTLLKPVPINPLRFRNPKRGLAWVGFAGPASNIIMAFLLSLFLSLNIVPASGFWGSIREILALLILVNTALALFNLLPVPPLDGSRILVGFLPNKFAKALLKLDRYGFILILTVFATVALVTGDLVQYIRIPLKAAWKLYGLSGAEFDYIVPPVGTT